MRHDVVYNYVVGTMAKRTAIIACLIATAIGAACFALSLIPASRAYAVESQFSAAPSDDSGFDAWLKSQTGVVPHTVHVQRHDDVLVLTFIMTQNSWRNPPFPDVENAASRLGYSIDSNGFVDQRD